MTPPTGHCDPAHRARVTLRALNTRVGVWPRLLFLGQLRDLATQCCSLPGQTSQVGDPPTAQPASRSTGPCGAEASAPSPMTPRVSPRILAAPEATSRICSTLWTRVPSRSAWCSHVVLRYRLRMWHMVESAVSSTDAAGTLQTAMPGDARHTGPSLGWSWASPGAAPGTCPGLEARSRQVPAPALGEGCPWVQQADKVGMTEARVAGGGGLPAWTTGHWTFLERVSTRPLHPKQRPPRPFSTREDGVGGTRETEQEELESPSDSEARRPATQQTGGPSGLWRGGPPSTAQTSLDEGQSPGW